MSGLAIGPLVSCTTPDYEAYGNYVPSQIGNRYDAFIYIDETKALIPIEVDETLI